MVFTSRVRVLHIPSVPRLPFAPFQGAGGRWVDSTAGPSTVRDQSPPPGHLCNFISLANLSSPSLASLPCNLSQHSMQAWTSEDTCPQLQRTLQPFVMQVYELAFTIFPPKDLPVVRVMSFQVTPYPDTDPSSCLQSLLPCPEGCPGTLI